MIVYVNGDGHVAAAESATPFRWAAEDPKFFYLGRAPHPFNREQSWANKLATAFRAGLHTDAEHMSSNARILRTTREWLDRNSRQQAIVIIQWSPPDRTERAWDGVYYQYPGTNREDLPQALHASYDDFAAKKKHREQAKRDHEEIWQLHQELEQRSIPHFFFNGSYAYRGIEPRDWNGCYLDPYDTGGTFVSRLSAQGFRSKSPQTIYYEKEAHSWWAQELLKWASRKA